VQGMVGTMIVSAFQLLREPGGFRVFSQITGHYLYRESKRAIIYVHSKVIALTGKRKLQSTVLSGVLSHGLITRSTTSRYN
jgi:hypothetical protein